jgi:hypothetical protein
MYLRSLSLSRSKLAQAFVPLLLSLFTGSELATEGTKLIAEALKVNSTLQKLLITRDASLRSIPSFLVFFFLLMLNFPSQ